MNLNHNLPKLAAPACRALAGAGVVCLADFSRFTEKEVAALHGMGPNAMAKIKEVMADCGICFAS